MKRRDILKSGLVLAGTTALAAPAIETALAKDLMTDPAG